MRLRFWLVLLSLLVPVASFAQTPLPNYQNWCQNGNVKPKTQGIASSYPFQASYPHCIITVYTHGTLSPLPTLYADADGLVPLANPFTSSNTGWYQFYAASGRYDVQETDCTPTTCNLPTPVTLPDIQLNVGGGGGGGGTPGCGLNDVQINNPLGSFGGDCGILQDNPALHTLFNTIFNAYQEVDISDATHSGLLDLGHSNGASVDFHFTISLSPTFGETYGIDMPDAAPTGSNQALRTVRPRTLEWGKRRFPLHDFVVSDVW